MIEVIPMDPTVVKSPQEGDEGVHGLSARAKNNAECYKLNFKKIVGYKNLLLSKIHILKFLPAVCTRLPTPHVEA